jgi:energy-coupling factor transport system substrate-specific component
MRDVFAMWKNTKMVVLVALSAGLYAALLIPFKGFVLIPGITEIRPASALPIVLGLLFGPAGAWGSAIGNLIGDFFGTLGIGSLFGFVGNFMFAYVPYKLWINLGLISKEDREPDLKTGRKILAYVVVSILGSAACALPIAWGLELLGMVPFAALGVGQEFLYSGFGAGGDVGTTGVILIGGIGTAGLIISAFIQSMPKKEA